MSSISPRYLLGHEISQSIERAGVYKMQKRYYSTTPIEFEIPQKGKTKYSFRCSNCGKDVEIQVKSRSLICLGRLKNFGWTLLGVFLLWLFEQLGRNQEPTFVSYLMLIPFLGLICFIVYNLSYATGRVHKLMFDVTSSYHRILMTKE